MWDSIHDDVEEVVLQRSWDHMHTYAGPYPCNFPCSMTYFLYKCHVHFHIHFIMDNVYKYYEEIMCNYAYIEQDFVKHVFKPLYG